MNQKQLNLILFLLVITVLVAGYFNLTIKKEYKKESKAFFAFKQEVNQIYEIKKLKQKIPHTLKTLFYIKNPKIIDKGNYKLYIFENLNLPKLNKLLRKILNSYLPINNLEIKSDATNRATVSFEVKK